jgi:hypothetical protein
MAVQTKDLKVGDVLHDVHRYKGSHVKASAEGHWHVRVTDVAEDGTWADLSWNGNPVRRYRGSVPSGYKRTVKEWIAGYDGARCSECYAYKAEGHRPHCDHPRAIAARKRAEKEAK